jgi:hypothetical protein
MIEAEKAMKPDIELLRRQIRECARGIVVAVAWTTLSLPGCSAKRFVPEAQLLPEHLPQGFELAVAADQIWPAVIAEVQSCAACKIVADNPGQHVISWTESVEDWRDLGQDTAVPSSLEDNQNKYFKLVKRPGKGTALTTVWLESQTSSSTLRIRRVYYGKESFPGIAHSRGEYERTFYAHVVQRLGR